jgi:sugar lactone lactonase YvrE
MDTAGDADGNGTAARFGRVAAIAADRQGNVYVSDSGNRKIRKITSTGTVTTIAGSLFTPGGTDGTGTAAGFFDPQAIAVDSAGTIYVADAVVTGSSGVTNRFAFIRKITAAGVVTTIQGSIGGIVGGLVVDGAGNLYISAGGCSSLPLPTPDPCAGKIYRISASGTATTLMTTAATGPAAAVGQPYGIALDGVGDVIAIDQQTHVAYKVSATGEVTIFAGTPGFGGYADAVGAAARFQNPTGLTLDDSGNLYVADTGNHVIRKIDAATAVTTIAGVAGQPAFVFGALPGRLNWPMGVAVSGTNLYIAQGMQTSQNTAITVIRNRP